MTFVRVKSCCYLVLYSVQKFFYLFLHQVIFFPHKLMSVQSKLHYHHFVCMLCFHWLMSNICPHTICQCITWISHTNTLHKGQYIGWNIMIYILLTGYVKAELCELLQSANKVKMLLTKTNKKQESKCGLQKCIN